MLLVSSSEVTQLSLIELGSQGQPYRCTNRRSIS